MPTFSDVTERIDREILKLAEEIRGELTAEVVAARRQRLMAASASLTQLRGRLRPVPGGAAAPHGLAARGEALRADLEAIRAALRENRDRSRDLDPEHIAMALNP